MRSPFGIIWSFAKVFGAVIGGILTSTALTDESDNAILDESGNALFSSGD